MFSTDKLETGSSGFAWKNNLPDRLISQIKFHVYATHHMQIGKEWAGKEFVNHYNRLYYVKSGEAVLESKGRIVNMRPGGLYLIPAYQLDSHKCFGQLDFYWCHFQAQIDQQLDFLMLYPSIEEHTCINEKEIEKKLIELVSLNDQDTMLANCSRNVLLMQLLMPFFEKIDRTKALTAQVKHNALTPAISKIHHNLQSPPQIKELAGLCNVSVEHFSRKFKAAFNISPKRYILAKQVAHAKQLLVSNSLRIEIVADQCGFSDIYHFSKTFKQEVGITPTEFRKEFQQ